MNIFRKSKTKEQMIAMKFERLGDQLKQEFATIIEANIMTAPIPDRQKNPVKNTYELFDAVKKKNIEITSTVRDVLTKFEAFR